MTRYLFDTSISHAVKPKPSSQLLDWMASQRDEDMFIATLTLAEIRRGILETPAGRRRDALESWFVGAEGPQALFAGRILPFDERAALIWAHLMAAGKLAGKPRSALDMVIASVASANGCVVATENERDFAGLDFINPARKGSKSNAWRPPQMAVVGGERT